MTLYDGSVERFMEENPGNRQDLQLLEKIFKDMLKALMFLAHKGAIHRDVKPANILYTKDQSATGLRFVLADFGLSREQLQARTLGVGTPLYMAPEMTTKGAKQSHKVDVYSLGATILILGDAGGIASTRWPSNVREVREIRAALEFALQDSRFQSVASLLCQDPMKRPSAQDYYLSTWPQESEARKMTPMLTD
jgi:serine/threonine protein kinase